MTHDNFQPPDIELPDCDEDDQLQAAYAEGRADERAENMRLLTWAYSKLVYRSFDNMEDALAMDEIKLMTMEAA
jgi:hypothetical protein